MLDKKYDHLMVEKNKYEKHRLCIIMCVIVITVYWSSNGIFIKLILCIISKGCL